MKQEDPPAIRSSDRCSRIYPLISVLCPLSSLQSPSPPAAQTSFQFLPEFHRRRISRHLSLLVRPGEGARAGRTVATAISNLIEPAFRGTGDSHRRLFQAQCGQNLSRYFSSSFVWQETQQVVAPSLRGLQRLFGMSGEMLAKLFLLSCHRHLISTR